MFNFKQKSRMKRLFCLSIFIATGLGLEPRLTGPKPAVLPLDDPVKIEHLKCYHI